MQNIIKKGYLIKSELGRGGMATVYLAHDNKFDTNVAIKVFNKEFVNNENIRKRFLAEAKSIFKMSHPNIIKVTDLIEEGDTVAFVMEYIEGENLKEYLDRKGKLSDEEIKSLFSQMLDAVGYVHKQNLVHRDIKPSNFMLDKKGKIKLIDFGIAKNLNKNSLEYTITEQHQIMGTVMYMSPEQIKSTKDVNLKSDIYSLGVVLWQMVTGKKPYDSSELSIPEIQVNIIKESLPNTKSIFDNIIQKSTQKNPDQRYTNIQSFHVAIQHPTNDQLKISNENFNDKTLIEVKTLIEIDSKYSDTNSKNKTETIKSSDKKNKLINQKDQDKKFSIVFIIGLVILGIYLTTVLSGFLLLIALIIIIGWIINILNSDSF
jgi:serine/threonine protein kinase